jgi:hypothetical protein
MIICVIIGATGIVTKLSKKSLEAIPGKHSVDLVQKTRNITQYGKYCSLKLENFAMRITVGSREVPARKGL